MTDVVIEAVAVCVKTAEASAEGVPVGVRDPVDVSDEVRDPEAAALPVGVGLDVARCDGV